MGKHCPKLKTKERHLKEKVEENLKRKFKKEVENTGMTAKKFLELFRNLRNRWF